MNRQKAIFIVYNSALHGLVLRALEQHNAKGYTEWSEVYGRGSATGEPHLGSHAWPTTNGAMMVITDAERAERILSALHKSQGRDGLMGHRKRSFPRGKLLLSG